MNLFDNSYVSLITTISEDIVMMPIKMFGPISASRKSLEVLDSLIDEPVERHTDKEFNSRLLRHSMAIAKGVDA